MSQAVMQGILGLLAAGALAAAGAALRPGRSAALPPAPRVTARETQAPTQPVGPSDSLLRAAARRAPFRRDRTLPTMAYDPDHTLQPPPSTPSSAPPKPALVLSGIVWGARPAAALEGLPGVDGALVARTGDTVHGITVRRIRRDAVIVTGFDTTWTLRVRVPWR